MTIQTKFSVGQKAIFLQDNKIVRKPVINISVAVFEQFIRIVYTFADDQMRCEDDCFSSSEEISSMIKEL